MNRWFVLLGVIVALAIAVGLYRGWFLVAAPTSAPGGGKASVTIDGDKIKEDATMIRDKAVEMTEDSRSKSP